MEFEWHGWESNKWNYDRWREITLKRELQKLYLGPRREGKEEWTTMFDLRK